MFTNRYNGKNKSGITKALWLSLSVFFLVFCSCPVKKFIRLHLYQHKEFAKGATDDSRLSSYDMKDCTIAERHQQSDILVLHLLPRPADDLHGHDFVHFASLLTNTSAVLFPGIQHQEGNYFTPHGRVMPIPVLLWVRRMQV